MNEIRLNINKIEDLDEILEVAEKVFRPNKEEKEKYHQKSIWLERAINGLLISAQVDNKIIGFAICYRKEDALHIWNVGVLEEYRKNGVWRKIYEEIVNFANKNKFSKITLNTHKNQFPGMYNFAVKEGFAVERTEFDELSKDFKSMFVKMI